MTNYFVILQQPPSIFNVLISTNAWAILARAEEMILETVERWTRICLAACICDKCSWSKSLTASNSSKLKTMIFFELDAKICGLKSLWVALHLTQRVFFGLILPS
jgi:hypothetical protein